MSIIIQENFDTYTSGNPIAGQNGGSGFSAPWTSGGGGQVSNLVYQTPPNSLQVNSNGQVIARTFTNPVSNIVSFTVFFYKTGGVNNLLFGLVNGLGNPRLYVQQEGSGGGIGSPNEITVRWNGIVILTGVDTINEWNQIDVEANTVTGLFRTRVNMGTWSPQTQSGTSGESFSGCSTYINGSNGPDYVDSFVVMNTLFPFTGVKYPLVEVASKEEFDRLRVFPYNY